MPYGALYKIQPVISVENGPANAGRDGQLFFRETKYSGANRGRDLFIFLADHEQYWQPCPVDPYSVVSDDHTEIRTQKDVLPARKRPRRLPR